MSLIDSASLIVTPNAYKEGTLYSVIPSDGSGDLSVTRATTATRVNSAGLVELVPYNLLQYSQQFTNAIWTPRNGTFTDNFATAPDGTLTASRWVATDTDPYVYQGFTGNGGNYVASVYVKGVGSSIGKTASIRVSGTLSNFTITGEWQRVQISTTISTSVIIGCEVPDPAVIGDTIYIWGFQLVEGSVAKDYQKTETRLNIPRLDYSNGTCPSILVEPQRTNYFPFSQNIANWYEPDDGVTLTSNTIDTVSPDGTNNASKITIVGGIKRSYQITNSVSGTGTFSAYVKAGTLNTLSLFTSSSSLLIGYNLSTLAVTQTIGTGTITSVGNGWYRITATSTLGASEVLQVLYTGNANETIYIWGFQVEAGSYATSYIPTTSASVTRNEDVISKTGISSLIGQTEGVLFAEVDYKTLTQSGTVLLDVNDNDITNRVVLLLGNGNVECFVQGSTRISYSLSSFGVYKIAFGYKSNDFVLYVNGVQRGTNTTSITFTGMNQLFLGNTFGLNNTQPVNGIKAAALWKTRLTNDELERLTGVGFNTYTEMANYYNYITQ